MFSTVIAGVDERAGGRDAIALAQRLLEPDGELVLATVTPGELQPWRGANADFDGAQRDDALARLAQVRDELGLHAELRTVCAPSVGHGLHVLAERAGADLLVIGSSHHGTAGRVLLGDDTRAAIDGAPCAVAVAPAGLATEPDLIREIGVGYNGTPESEHALEVGRALARRFGAKLSAFEAVALPSYAFAGEPVMIDETYIEQLLSSAREQLEGLPGVEAHVTYGVPAAELIPYSASVDLLIVGSRGYGALGRMIHGSTTLALARGARCPLLVMTRAARAAAAAPERPMATA